MLELLVIADDFTGALDTGVQLATSTEGGPACLSSYGYQQREGYAGFYVSGAGDTDGTMYELNLATGEVTPAENP